VARTVRGPNNNAFFSGQDLPAGPYQRLVVRGATMIDGTGAPPRGPVDIVVEGEKAERNITSRGTGR
jgi:hypothetical protein